MTIEQIKKRIKEEFPNGRISPSYFLSDGKYHSGILYSDYDDIPKEISANPLDRGLVCISIDEQSGKIECYRSSLEMEQIFRNSNSIMEEW